LPDDRVHALLAARLGRGPVAASEWDGPARYAELEARLRANGTWPDPVRPRASRVRAALSRHATALGAALATAVVLALGLRFAPHGVPAPMPATVYATVPGQRAEITLVDGTRVVLNVGSRMEVPRDFGERDRQVRLRGEAYFHVAHAAGAPFVVDGAGARVRVLGTEFAVRAYDSAGFRVAVRSGRVAVGRMTLSASDVAVRTADGMQWRRHADVDGMLGFTTGHLVLTDVRLRDALVELNRWYDADVRLATPSLGDERINVVVPSGSASDLSVLLQSLLNARVARAGRVLTITK